MNATNLRNLVGIIAICLMSNASFAVTAGDQAPPWTGTNLIDGKQVEFPKVLNGKPAVIVFWATWCPYCKAFMPYAKEIREKYAAHGVQVISFNAKERGRGDPAAYAKSLGFPLVAIANADGIAADYNIPFIPGLMVVDGTGKITYRRRSTDLPPGKTVSEQWADEVTAALEDIVHKKG